MIGIWGIAEPRCGFEELARVPLVGMLLSRAPGDGFVDSKLGIVPAIIGMTGGGGMLDVRAGAGRTTGVGGTLLLGSVDMFGGPW